MNWNRSDRVLPEFGTYVVVWMPTKPWVSRSKTVFASVCCRVEDKGIAYPEGWRWEEFGPADHQPNEVTHWARIRPPEPRD